jgi:molybdate transport system regulatory protein
MNIRHGTVNDEVEVFLEGSNTKITSVITNSSAKSLGLEPGKRVSVLIKASWVVLISDSDGVKFSAGNNLPGTVVSVKCDAVNAEVNMRLDGGEPLAAMVTESLAKKLDIKAGDRFSALFEASNVILGVDTSN